VVYREEIYYFLKMRLRIIVTTMETMIVVVTGR